MKNLGQYASEIEGMEDFWKDVGLVPDYSCSTDGYYNGYLVEFKLNSFDTEAVKKQLIRYVKARNAAALELPRYGLGICINQGTWQLYDLLRGQETEVKNGTFKDVADLLTYVNIKGTKITQNGWIDETSIINYNDLFYTSCGKTSKDAFIAELANPTILKIDPYVWNETGDMERRLLDCLGSIGLKKRLGAFFTPDYAVEKSTKYLRDIISSLPDDNYVIVDRCCGTGNLEKFLTDEELSHCILNTINYAEWLTTKGLYEGRVKAILPADESSLNNKDGLLKDGDALEESFYNSLNPLIQGKTVILLENPPYSEPQAAATRKGETFHRTSENFITEKMKASKVNGVTARDMANKFIWSGFNIVNADYYVVYSPVKYFKSQNLVNKKFLEGCLVNRKDFHATEGGISIMSWKGENENVDSWKLDNAIVNRVKTSSADNLPNDCSGTPYCYIASPKGTPDFKHALLINELDKKKGGVYSTAKACDGTNIKQAIVPFAANCYVCKGFTEKEVIWKSADGGLTYLQDDDFVNDCLIFCGLTNKNKCTSNKTIKNECCIGQATKLDSIIDATAYSGKAKSLKFAWDMVLAAARNTTEYNSSYNYGLYQIEKDLNVKEKVVKADGSYATNKKGEYVMEHKYPILNAALEALKKELTKYYTTYIVPKLFQYELLK